MFFKKSFMILAIVVTLISLTAVSAADDNITGNLNDDDMTFESSVNDEILLEDSNDLDGCDDGKLGQTNQYNLADEGEFIDVEDAYIFLNQFRNESGVWQWNSDDKTKTVFNTATSNQLQPLERDIDLEETAKIRAKELAQSFSHVRPDGSDCFTAFPDDLLAMGENITAGQTSCREVADNWKETNNPYSGQGHRRNMLSTDFNCVGIAGYKLNGVVYWVQDFGYNGIFNKGQIASSNTNSTG